MTANYPTKSSLTAAAPELYGEGAKSISPLKMLLEPVSVLILILIGPVGWITLYLIYRKRGTNRLAVEFDHTEERDQNATSEPVVPPLL
jgi:hypothetical protein